MAEKLTLLYERLSRDDENQGESYSITNQKKLLENYAEEHNFFNTKHFTDDGISGTRFDRPGFLAMSKVISEGKANVLLVKDMSRIGRDYLKVGQFMELLRQKGVRLIAVNDGTDTFQGDDDFTPFRNIMNEYYARDISKKIRSTFKTKGLSGKHVASAVPYGYMRDPNDHNHWIVDEEAAEVVRRIFQMTIEGHGPYQIAEKLSKEQLLIPSAHLKKRGEGLRKNSEIKNPYKWGSSTIAHMLEKYEYLGHTVNFKTAKHFKDKKSHYVDKDQWVVFENTQEPIIDQKTFDLVQTIRSKVTRRYPDGWGDFHILTGLVYCADCGAKMYVHRPDGQCKTASYTCSNYTKQPTGTRCPTYHRILEPVLLTLLKDVIQSILEYAKIDRDGLCDLIKNNLNATKNREEKKVRARLREVVLRIEELEKLQCRIYEDNVLGKVSDKAFQMMSGNYENESDKLKKEKKALEQQIQVFDEDAKMPRRFMEIVDKYVNCTELTNTMIVEFVDKICVHERAEKRVQETTQQVDIYFNFIGQFVPPNFVGKTVPKEPRKPRVPPADADRYQRKLAQHRAYYDRNKEKFKALRDARKAAKRAELIEQGIFIPGYQMPPAQPKIGVPSERKIAK